MPSEWRSLTVEQLKAPREGSIAIGPFGSRMKADLYVPDGVPVIRGNNISDSLSLVGEFVYVSDDTADELRSSNVFAGDLVFPHRGAIGLVAIVPEDEYPRYMLSTSLMKLSVNTELVDPLFVYYYFRSEHGRHTLLRYSSTVGTPGIGQPLASLRSIRLEIPPLWEQRHVIRVLSAIDDRIQLNRRMNETLEAIARALFKSWFVDFDPVRAKDKGRDPGLPQPIAGLFPDRVENTELGEIPAGWKPGSLGDVAEHPRRATGPDEIVEGTPYIALEHMPRRSIALSEWASADGVESGKFAFQRGEILFGKFRPYFHKVGVAPVDGVCSTDIVVVHPLAEEWFGITLGTLSSDQFVEFTSAGSTGTKMPRTGWNEMARYRIAIPPSPVARAFNDRVRPMVDRMVASTHENRTLAAIRDALLAKLISGEIRVPQAEHMLEAAPV